MKIIVMTNGWVLLGELKKNVLTKARVVRRWGTNEGIGELRNGKLKDTVLDELPDTKINKKNIIFEFEVEGF